MFSNFVAAVPLYDTVYVDLYLPMQAVSSQ
jgi:hypothetical protein